MIIINWLKGRNKLKETVMPDIKDVVTDELVKKALQSETVVTAVKEQIKTDLENQIDSAVDASLTSIFGVADKNGDTA